MCLIYNVSLDIVCSDASPEQVLVPVPPRLRHFSVHYPAPRWVAVTTWAKPLIYA